MGECGALLFNDFYLPQLLQFGQKKLILAGALLGVGLTWTTTSIVSSIAYKWFPKNQETILGAVLASNVLGAALAAQIVTPLIYQEGNPFGYQDSSA